MPRSKVTYLRVHLWVVQHGDKLLKEELAGNLLVERCVATVDEDVEDTKREEDHSQLRHLQPP